jgi:hypothetical protein
MRMNRSAHAAFAGLLLVALPIEVYCARLAFHTLGEVISAILLLAVGLNIFPIALYALRYRVAAIVAALAIVVAIVPYQLILGERLLELQMEASHVVAYAYETQARTGEFPPDLTTYHFTNPDLRDHFEEYQTGAEHGGFAVRYWVGTRSTSHWYSPRTGWGYYPD